MVTDKDSTIKHSLVAGLFARDADVHAAIRELVSAGFSSDAIQEFGHRSDTTAQQKEGGSANALTNFFSLEPQQTMSPSSATGATITTSELVRLGLTQEDADSLQRGLSDGDVLVIVHTDNRGMDALEILKRHDASPGIVEFDGAPTTAATATTAIPATTAALPASGAQRIELLKEVLRVNKERVQRGEVRLRKEVVSETQTVEVPTIREELVIERHPVADGQAASGQIGDDASIRVTLSEDRVTTEKRAVVAEEVTIGKREVQETQQVSETVRREELRTEREGDVVIEGDTTQSEPKKPLL